MRDIGTNRHATIVSFADGVSHNHWIVLSRDQRILQAPNKLGDVKPDFTLRVSTKNTFEDYQLKSAAEEYVLVQVASLVVFYPDKAR